MTTDREILTKPFDRIKQRRGAANKLFSYVGAEDVIQRLLDATADVYTWEIVRYERVEGTPVLKTNRQTGEKYAADHSAYWLVHGRLTLPGLGSRDGIGTQMDETEDAPKAAETDALKRAAVKFGVALHLYREDDRTGANRHAAVRAPGSHPDRPQTHEQAPAPRSEVNSHGAAAITDGQAAAIRSLCRRLRLEPDQPVREQFGGKTLGLLTTDEAGEMIRVLNKARIDRAG